MPGQSVHDTQPHAGFQHGGMDDMAELKVIVFHGCSYNQTLADVRSPDAGIKCLYYNYVK